MLYLRAAVWLLALAPSLWLAGQFLDLPHLGDFHDDALYLTGAKALAEGAGHTQISLPEKPAQTKYPPLFAAWLAVGWQLNPQFPANLSGFLPLVWIWLPALALVSRAVFRDLGFEEEWAVALSAVVLLNPIAAYFSVSLMAELMTATLLMAALALAERGRAWTSGVAAALAFLVKSMALPALVTIPLIFGWRRQFRKAMYFAITAWPAFLGWSVWTALHRTPGTADDYYVDYVGFYLANHSWTDLPVLAIKNVPILVMSAGRLLAFTAEHSGWANYLSTLLGLVSLFSFARLGGRFTAYHAFGMIYFPMLIFWNFTPHERFLLPVLPLLIAGLAWEIRQMPKMMTWSKPAAMALTVTLFWLNFGAILEQLPSVARAERAQRQQLAGAYEWVRRHTPPNTPFLAARDPLFYLHTGRPARGMHFPTRFFYHDQRDQIVRYFADAPSFMRRHHLTHAFVLDQDHAMDLAPAEVSTRLREVLAREDLRTEFNEGPARVLTLQSDRAPVAPVASPRASR